MMIVFDGLLQLTDHRMLNFDAIVIRIYFVSG